MKINWRVLAIVIFIGIILFAGLVWINFNFTRTLSGGSSFLVPWAGARSYLAGQSNPYMADAAYDIQRSVYGRIAEAGEFPYRLDYPFHLLIFFFPFGLIEDFALARAAWMAVSEIALLGVALLSVELVQWKPSRALLTLFLGFSLAGWYSFSAIMEGSVTPLLAFFFIAALWMLREGQDEIAGILLIFTTYKWEVTWFVWLLLLVWLISHRRGRALAITLMGFAVLMVISLLLLPSWPLEFLRATVANLRAVHGLTLDLVLQNWWPERGQLFATVLKTTLFVVLFVEWRAVRGKDFRRFVWVASLTLAVTPLIGIPNVSTDYAFLLFPLALVSAVSNERWPRFGSGVAAFILLALFAIWLLIWPSAVIPSAILDGVFFILLPAFLILALYWLRWWVIRPPRTWADQAAELKR